MDAKLIKAVTKYCSQRGICKYGNQCKPVKCKYFKYVVLPTWRKDIKSRKGEYWERSEEYGEYDAIVDLVY